MSVRDAIGVKVTFGSHTAEARKPEEALWRR